MRGPLSLGIGILCALVSVTLQAQTCPAKQWATPPPEISGWHPEQLAALTTLLKTSNTTAMTIVHRGNIVFDYGKVTSSYNLRSARKSIMSMLYGIAIDKGQAKLTATVGSLGIDDIGGLSDTEKTATVQQLLEARSCIYHEAEYETAGMKAARPARHSCKPGEQWHYNNWDFNALGTTYKIQTGKTVFDGFSEELAKPLEMQNFNAFFDTQFVGGRISRHPAYPIQLSSHDFARLGLLMARNGNWCGKQIIPTRWIDESTAPISTTDSSGVEYGYLWWTSAAKVHFGHAFGTKVYSARGHLGQVLIVVPAYDLVIAHLVDGDEKAGRFVSAKDFRSIVKTTMAAMPRNK